jgi:urea ABC transporter permease protein UrtB
MAADELLNTGLSISYGIATLLVISLGLAVIFGIMGVINLAHGEFVMLGAFTTVTAANAGVTLWLAMLMAPVAVAALGLVIERGLIRHLYDRRVEGTLLATFGLSLILQQAAALIFGTSPEGVGTPLGNASFGRFTVSEYDLVIMAAAGVLIAIVVWLFTRTRYGLLARATMQNREMAGALGVNTSRVNMLTFALGSALAGAAGALLAPTLGVVPSMGQALIPQAFMTVVVGGPAAVTGTTASAGLLGGIQEIVAEVSTPFLGTGALLVAAIVILRVMPEGLSGRWGRSL